MTTNLTSKNNDLIKFINKLKNSSKVRNKEKKFLIEGYNLCKEAIKNNIKISKIFYTEKFYEKHTNLIDELLSKNNLEKYIINETILKFISDTDCPQGIICLCDFFDKQVNINILKQYSNIILLENIQNPSNLGSIFRSLDAFNIDLVAITSTGCDIYNPKVLRGSMGSIFRLNSLVIEDSKKFLLDLKTQNFKIIGTIPNSGKSVTDLENISKKVVILGNEGNGMSDELISICDENITIPMNPECESLNVSVATGIIAWEMCGRRM